MKGKTSVRNDIKALAEACQRFQAGEDIVLVASALGLKPKSLRAYWSKAGISYAKSIPCVDCSAVFERIKKGEAITGVARDIGVDPGRLVRSLRKEGFFTRLRGEQDLLKTLLDRIENGEAESAVVGEYGVSASTLHNFMVEVGLKKRKLWRPPSIRKKPEGKETLGFDPVVIVKSWGRIARGAAAEDVAGDAGMTVDTLLSCFNRLGLQRDNSDAACKTASPKVRPGARNRRCHPLKSVAVQDLLSGMTAGEVSRRHGVAYRTVIDWARENGKRRTYSYVDLSMVLALKELGFGLLETAVNIGCDITVVNRIMRKAGLEDQLQSWRKARVLLHPDERIRRTEEARGLIERKGLTVKEAAEAVGLSSQLLYRYLLHGVKYDPNNFQAPSDQRKLFVCVGKRARKKDKQ